MSGRRTGIRSGARKEAIWELVEQNGMASVEEIAKKFNTSLETIRRDLNVLADAGRVRKVHGGVRRITYMEEGLFSERLARNRLAKKEIAEKLAKTFLPNQSLFIDTGSTTLLCAEVLSKIKNLTVITNSTLIAGVFSGASNNSKVILLGGSYRYDNAQTVGPTTIEEIGRFRTDHAILTVGTLDNKGAADFSDEEAQVARAMIKAAESLTFVVDSSKLNRSSTYHVCELNQIDRLIIEKIPDTEFQEALKSAGVELL